MTPELIDTHCHLTFPPLADRVESVLADARRAGVARFITVACSPGELDAALALARVHEGVWVAAGVHPHEAARVDDADLERIARAWRDDSLLVAAGEMGLDYHYDYSPRPCQQRVFARQLELAADAGLPVVVHCREAHEDAVRILTSCGYAGRPVVFHCFSGTVEQVAELRAHGWRVSFTGVLTFRNAEQTRRVCAATPLDAILLETDSPYLSPEPVRMVRPNVPAHLVHIARFAAELHGVPYERMVRASTAAAVAFFGLSTGAS